MNCIVENMLNNISTQTIKSIQNDCKNKELANFFNDKNPRERAIIEDSKNDPIARRMDPKTQQDIKLLSSELKMWQKNQFEEIEQMRDISVEERIKLRSDVLSKETFLLRKIESMRQGIRFTNEQSDLDEKLNELSKPHRWILSNGEEIEVMTSSRKHCCDLVRMYQEYSNDFDQSVSQRLRLLTEARKLLHGLDQCSTVKEICCLFDRERDLLRRGMSQSLPGLRTRISNLLLQLIEMLQIDHK